MSDKLQILNRYASLVNTLNELFKEQRDELVKGELILQYNFSTKIDDLLWLKKNLPILSESLLNIPSNLKLKIAIQDCFCEEFRVRGDTSKLELEWVNPDQSKEVFYGELPEGAIGTYDELWKRLKEGSTSFPIAEVYMPIEKLNMEGARLDIQLTILIHKKRINEDLILTNIDRQNIISFLFPEALVSILNSISLETFENDFYNHGTRAVIPIFGFSGYLKGEYLTICGNNYIGTLQSDLSESLSDEALSKANKSLNLRQYHSLGLFPTKYLTPDIFSITIDKDGDNNVKTELLRQLNSFRALLSALFLADYTESINGGYRVEYMGRGQVSLFLERTTLLEFESYLNDLYQLYIYAYDGFSADKLEIAQQFLSLSAIDIESLCKRAIIIKGATKNAYDNVLVGKVRDYFDARQKIQEIIKTAIAETSNSIISLTRDVSKDLYTIAGVIAIAIIGILLKPEFNLRSAALAVSLVIAAYLCLVILYHLSTLKQAYNLQMGQRIAYIKSFENILGNKEIEIFLEDKQLTDINALFNNTLEYAYIIYVVFLAISLFVAIISF